MAETLTIRTASSTEVVKIAVPGPQGPKGDKGDPGDVAGLPLSTQGDTLYRGASENQRLPIGTSGQILKVSAGGIPEWANESGAVSSVAGKTGVVTLDKNDVGLGNVANTAQVTSVTGTAPIVSSGGTTPAISVTVGTTANTVCAGNDARLSDSRTPTAHAAAHASSGSDALAPSDIGAQSIFVTESLVLSTSAQVTLTAARAKIFDVLNFSGSDVDVVLPQTGNQVGDTFVFRWASGSNQILVRGVSAGSPVISLTSGEQKRVIRGTSNWSVIPVDTHTHAASAIVSGTLTHERGGLEADVSAYNGLVKISGGSTSAVTLTSAGEALLDDADAAAQRATLGLGTAATAATGDFAAASHSHELTALAATGATNGHVLTANGSNGVTFAALPASGVTGAASSASDVLGVSGANITGVDANADRIVFWDDSASKLTYLEAGLGLTISGTVMTASGGASINQAIAVGFVLN